MKPYKGQFPRGAIPTPKHRIAAAPKHKHTGTTPSQVIVIPSFLEMWLNDTDGDCVTAEEAFAKAAYSVMNGLPETKITDATVKTFCDKFGFLNGANLTDVMDKMISDGFIQDSGYKDGPYTSVDYSNEAVLQNAISVGPVKIGIDASALPSGAGNANGWYDYGGTPQEYTNEDHCVSLCGYGPSSALFTALGIAVPAGFPTAGYLLYTWSTIGVVDHAWIMSTVGEAWLRNPTTAGITPSPNPNPNPNPGPSPTPTEVQIQTAIDAILSAAITKHPKAKYLPGVKTAVDAAIVAQFTASMIAKKKRLRRLFKLALKKGLIKGISIEALLQLFTDIQSGASAAVIEADILALFS